MLIKIVLDLTPRMGYNYSTLNKPLEQIMNINDTMTAIYDKYGVFFAFSNKQFEEKQQEGVTYVNMGSGMVCPKEHTKTVNTELHAAINAHIKYELETIGKEKLIRRELDNHEADYTGEIDDTVEALDGYGITRNEVMAVFCS